MKGLCAYEGRPLGVRLNALLQRPSPSPTKAASSSSSSHHLLGSTTRGAVSLGPGPRSESSSAVGSALALPLLLPMLQPHHPRSGQGRGEGPGGEPERGGQGVDGGEGSLMGARAATGKVDSPQYLRIYETRQDPLLSHENLVWLLWPRGLSAHPHLPRSSGTPVRTHFWWAGTRWTCSGGGGVWEEHLGSFSVM